MPADLAVPKFIYNGIPLIMTLPPTLSNYGVSRVGGEIEADSGMRATYIIRDDDSRSFVLRFYEDEYPEVQAMIDEGMDGAIIEYFPDSANLSESYLVVLDSPSVGMNYYAQPDPQQARVLTLPITITGWLPGTFNDETIDETSDVQLPWTPQFVVGETRYIFTYPVTRWIPGEGTTGSTAKDTRGTPGPSLDQRKFLLGLNLRFLSSQWSMVREFILAAERAQTIVWDLGGIAETLGSLVVKLESPRVSDRIVPVRDATFPDLMSLSIVLSSAGPFPQIYFPPEPKIPALVATGGTMVVMDDFIYHEFIAGDTFNVASGTSDEVRVLIVAGGGGGGDSQDRTSGGGGAGGVIETVITVGPGSYSIVVGSGGQGGHSAGPVYATNGSDSSFYGLDAVGGGHGNGYYSGSAANGGSGGGSRHGPDFPSIPVAGQGHAGGNPGLQSGDITIFGACGGGGAGAVGGAAFVDSDGLITAGAGGIGHLSDITGTPIYYGGGGGGGVMNYGAGAARPVAPGGLGGGGAGASGLAVAVNGQDGTPHTGGGGGGAARAGGNGGNGGSGKIIIRYPRRALI